MEQTNESESENPKDSIEVGLQVQAPVASLIKFFFFLNLLRMFDM